MLVVTRAIVATGSYGPKGFSLQWHVPQGAEEADGETLVRVVRDQIGHGADWIKVYADYRWGPQGEALPTFSVEELRLITATARSSGRPTVAHATTPEGMRRAIEGRRRDHRARRRRNRCRVQGDGREGSRVLSHTGRE